MKKLRFLFLLLVLAPASAWAQSADLDLTKTVDNPTPNVGDNVVFTLTVTNSGPSATVGVLVTDLLPSGYTYISDDSSIFQPYDSATGVWDVGGIAAPESHSLNITAMVNASGIYLNTAEVTASFQSDPDSTPNNGDPTEDDYAEASTTPSVVVLTISKVDSPDPVTAGSNITCTTRLTEAEAPAARGPTVQVTTPSDSIPPPVAETNVVLVGTVSVITTPVASSLPVFKYEIV